MVYRVRDRTGLQDGRKELVCRMIWIRLVYNIGGEECLKIDGEDWSTGLERTGLQDGWRGMSTRWVEMASLQDGWRGIV
jgi:hypothetical protein